MPPVYKNVDKFDNVDIKIQLGNYVLNVVFLRRVSDKFTKPIPRHSHCNYELHFQSKGLGHTDTDFGDFPIEPGSLYITGPNVFHCQHFDSDKIMEEYNIGFEFIKHKEERSHFFFVEDADNFIEKILSEEFVYGKADDSLKSLFIMLFEQLKNPREGSFEIIKSFIVIILITAFRTSLETTSKIKLPEKNLDEQRKFIIEKYFLFIKPDMSPEDLASQLCISVRQLNRIIKEYYDKSFKDKLFESKFECSLTYLSNPKYKISEISELLCFSNEFQFSNQFKKYFGMTPSEYRKKKL